MPSPNTFTPNLGLLIPGTGQANWQILADLLFTLLDNQAPIGGLAVAPSNPIAATGLPSNLLVNVSAGAFVQAAGSIYAYAGATGVTLPASATTCLWLTDAGALTQGATFPAGNIVRLASVTTSGTAVTAIVDKRVAIPSAGAGLGGLFLPLAASDVAAVVVVHAGTSHGLQIGGAASDLLGFRGATPVVQPSGAAQAAAPALTTTTLTDSTGGTAGTTLAAATNTAPLTDSTGGTAGSTLAAISDSATANAVASLAAQLATQRALNVVLVNAVASLAAQVNHAEADLAAHLSLLNALRSGLVTQGILKGSA